MLDPYWRINLENKEGAKYETKFKAPDHNGVYKFKIDYQRFGYSHLNIVETTPVRVFRHDEFPRFIPSAYPYYSIVFAVTAGFLLFSIFFLFTKEVEYKNKPKKEEKKKTTKVKKE